ncbi:MAG: putative nucleotidyltransferase substrate binding domain-containing protein [Corynebacterium sp.]|nr:putative nucleotidyltransferase substrate binding domain-containing protein [Corynebacterium sp.]
MLHESLLELSEAAPNCPNDRTARGILAESQDLIRNAIEHEAKPQELVYWFSQLVTAVLHSEGVRNTVGGARLILTGAIGREDALPSSPIKWLAVHDTPVDTSPVHKLLSDVGLRPEATSFGLQSRPQGEWADIISAADGPELAVLADAGTWILDSVVRLDNHLPLLQEAIDRRPPAVIARHGLPDREVSIDVRNDLLYPIIAIARWAGTAANSVEFSTPARIQAATAAGILTPDQAGFLSQAWESGLQLQFRRWTDRIDTQAATADLLPGIQRSVFGASCRQVAEVLRALAAQHSLVYPA